MTSLSNQQGFVFYQLPESNEVFFIQGKWKKINIHQSSEIEGFIVSNSDKSATCLLEETPTLVSNSFQFEFKADTPETLEVSKKEYLTKVDLFVNACKTNLKKIISSRIKKHPRDKSSNIFDTYLHLCETYSHSFNYLINIPELGTWMGATPEPLLQGNNGSYTTVSLAGSQSISEDISWKTKEIKEQQFVTDYISSQLNSHKITFTSDKKAKTTIAGNLAHLKTLFELSTTKPPLAIADILHPTPAVCGLPQDKALAFISKNENYDRNLYTGFLGPIGSQSCNLFVNLRCMQIFKDEYWLYVGGGITTDSIPEKEWLETELKAQTLLKVLESN